MVEIWVVRVAFSVPLLNVNFEAALKPFLSLAALACLTALPVQASVVTYDDRAAFLAALGATDQIITETFDTPMAQQFNFTFDSGIKVTANHINDRFNVNAAQQYAAAVNSTDGQIWTLPTDVYAIGFDAYNLGLSATNNEAVQITISDGDGTLTIELSSIAGGANGFIGFIGAAPFDPLIFNGIPGARHDVFQFDDVAMAIAGPAPDVGIPGVPLPAAGGLLAGAMGLLMARRRRRG